MAFDLDAVRAEAEGEPFEFTFGGETYLLPPQIDMRVLIDVDEDHLGNALRRLLGPEQYQRMYDAREAMDVLRFNALMEAYAAHVGTTLGESQASPRSSRSTARPSKRTSSVTTTRR